jgi:hypothetical protein
MRIARRSKLVSIISCLIMACDAVAFAQAENDSKKQEAEVAVIALGPRPVRKYAAVEGKSESVMLLAQPGETPPARLYYRSTGSEEKDGNWNTWQLSFNNASILRPFPAGREIKLYRRLSEEKGYEPYVTLPAMPAASRMIFFLLPGSGGEKPWEKTPAFKVVNLGDVTYTDKRFVMANFSRHTVQHAFEQNVETVEPNQLIGYQHDQVGQIYRLAARYGIERKIIYNTAVRLSQEGHTQLFVLYNANPATNAGRNVGVFKMVVPMKKMESKDEALAQ